MPDLMLELFSEEIPSRMQVKAMQSITEQVSKGLSEKDLPFKSMHSFVTPRRLGIEIVGLNKNVPQKTKEIRGPGINAPDSALNGFLKSNFLKKNERYSIELTEKQFLEVKKKAMNCYRSELRESPHPRSLSGIEALARIRGSSVGWEYSESFALVRHLDA